MGQARRKNKFKLMNIALLTIALLIIILLSILIVIIFYKLNMVYFIPILICPIWGIFIFQNYRIIPNNKIKVYENYYESKHYRIQEMKRRLNRTRIICIMILVIINIYIEISNKGKGTTSLVLSTAELVNTIIILLLSVIIFRAMDREESNIKLCLNCMKQDDVGLSRKLELYGVTLEMDDYKLLEYIYKNNRRVRNNTENIILTLCMINQMSNLLGTGKHNIFDIIIDIFVMIFMIVIWKSVIGK